MASLKSEETEKLFSAIGDLSDNFNKYRIQQDFTSKKIETFTDTLVQLELQIQKLVAFGDSYESDNSDRNDEAIAEIKQAREYLINEKSNIAKEVVNSLGLEDIKTSISTSSGTLQKTSGMLQSNLESITTIVQSLTAQTNSLALSVGNLKKMGESISPDVNYNREVENIVNFIKASQRNLTIDELLFRFNSAIVKKVLETGETLGFLTAFYTSFQAG